MGTFDIAGEAGRLLESVGGWIELQGTDLMRVDLDSPDYWYCYPVTIDGVPVDPVCL